MKRICGLMLLFAIALPSHAADETKALATLFPLRAQVSAEGSGLSRLEITPEIISACRPDLADLRILGGDGREIPYLIDSPEPQSTSIAVLYEAQLEILDASRSQLTLDDRTTTFFESFELLLPTPPPDVQAWQLEMMVGTTEFVSRIHVMAVDRTGGVRTIIRGSAFRLPAAGAEKLGFTFAVPRTERLRVELESQNNGFLQPRFTVEASRTLPTTPSSEIELPLREIRTEFDTTEVVIDRPRGFVPRRLAIATTTDTYRRRVTVWDEGPGADPEALGVGTVLRIAAIAPVEVVELPIRAPRGDRLRLVIENLDSPPLDNLEVSALMPRPVVVFSMPIGTPEPMLYFGGGRARRPRYDLATLDRLPVSGEGAHQAVAVLDPAQAHQATIGPVERNPDYNAAPALAFAMHPGATLDARLYSHKRHLEIKPSAEGLSWLRLSPGDLAMSRHDLADLRIIDTEGRQWAYLKQHNARAVTSQLAIVSHPRDGNRTSRYELEIPEGPLAINRIEIETVAPFFDRDFSLRGRLEDGSDLHLARGRLIRRAGDPRPVIVTLEPRRVVRLELEVKDGDDAPLEFLKATAHSTVPDIYTAAVAGQYDLLLGYPDAVAPIYELERIRSTILAVPAATAAVGAIEPNPVFRPASRLSRSGGAQKFLLWGVLGLAVIVLIFFTLRAARQEQTD